jgi:hypothetical protein
MNNRDMQATWKYHDGTKHSYWSIRNNPHILDWANRPQPFKIYPNIEPLPLSRDVPQTGVAALSAISEPVPSSGADSVPDLQDLARILYFSAGITKQRKYPGGEIYFRAAACTGALYEIELYVVTGDLAGLDAGVLSLQSGGCIVTSSAKRRLSHKPGSGDGDGTGGGSRARDDYLHWNILAERLEVPGAHLSPFRLGQRHAAGESAGRFCGFGAVGRDRARVRGRRGEPPTGYAARGFVVPRTDRAQIGEFAATSERGSDARPVRT